jgi:hypothetical protein
MLFKSQRWRVLNEQNEQRHRGPSHSNTRYKTTTQVKPKALDHTWYTLGGEHVPDPLVLVGAYKQRMPSILQVLGHRCSNRALQNIVNRNTTMFLNYPTNSYSNDTRF